MFELKPKGVFGNNIEFKQTIAEENLDLCEKNKKSNCLRIRARHSLKIVNCSMDKKFLFSIKYEPDTSCIAMCNHSESKHCDGGENIWEEKFPIPQTYWQGIAKSVSRLTCWQFSDDVPDANLHIYISSEAFRTSQIELSEEENYCFIVYANKDN